MVEVPVGTEVGAIGSRMCDAGHTFRYRKDPTALVVLEEGSDEGGSDVQM